MFDSGERPSPAQGMGPGAEKYADLGKESAEKERPPRQLSEADISMLRMAVEGQLNRIGYGPSSSAADAKQAGELADAGISALIEAVQNHLNEIGAMSSRHEPIGQICEAASQAEQHQTGGSLPETYLGTDPSPDMAIAALRAAQRKMTDPNTHISMRYGEFDGITAQTRKTAAISSLDGLSQIAQNHGEAVVSGGTWAKMTELLKLPEQG